MNFFENVENNEQDSHGIFAEKYRPKSMDEYICNDHLKRIFKEFINKKEIPHLLLHSAFPGSGKTSLAKILVNSIPCDHIYVNVSDHTGVDYVRDTLKPFASSSGFNDLKIVILDEFDFSSVNYQASLRSILETYSKNTRFILTCNYVEKIIQPLISRCQVFEIEPPSKKDVAIYTKNILDKEKITFDLTDFKKVIDDFYPDIRKIINFLQQSSSSGTLKLVKSQGSSYDTKNKLIELLKSSTENSNAFNNIRQLINDSGSRTFDDLYSELFDKCSEYASGKETSVIIYIAEHIFQSSMVVDKEITFMACIIKIIRCLNSK